MTDFSKYNLTPSAKNSLIRAQEIASEYDCLKVIDVHLLYSILEVDHNNIDHAFFLLDYNKEGFLQALELVFKEYKEPKRKKKIFAPEIFEILDKAYALAKYNKDEFIGIDHILASILRTRKHLSAFFMGLNVHVDVLLTNLVSIISTGVVNNPPPTVSANQNVKQQKTKSNISEFCENINDKIKTRGTFEIFGRTKETERSFEVLCRKNKSNVILVGDAGVGKTAIVEGMVEKILQKKCPDFLKNKKILSLDMTSLLAGTMYRGQMEEKVKSIIEEISSNKDYILFIDEIHTIVGAGNSEGGLDLANSLKPVLSRGSFTCIGATTKEEYSKYIKGDSALNRRFEKIDVDEPSQKETLELLMKAKLSYEKFHNVKFNKKSIEKIIDLCELYLPKKRFPDKAFDILDQAGVKAKLKNKKSVPLENIYEIFAQKLDTSIDNVKNKSNINVNNNIGFF
jgi:ATP-dependent Clp protease ATP-binding subunit ClpC